MKIHKGYENLAFKRPVVTMGSFDGIHRGHEHLLGIVRKRAMETDGESVVITFYPHPRQVLEGKEILPALLTTPDEKAELIGKTGIDNLVIVEFDNELSNRETCEFMGEVLMKKIGTRLLIVGYNHHFGKKGEGEYRTIQQCASELGMEIEIVKALEGSSGAISSSLIREALLEGRLGEANELLGYSYFVKGRIVEGRGLGRTIGYPTANIEPSGIEKLIPRDGVYAVDIEIEGVHHCGVMSIGVNPSVNINRDVRSLEVNIFDFGKDIYGSEVTVKFRFRLRDEMFFGTLEELAAQIEADRKLAAELLAGKR